MHLELDYLNSDVLLTEQMIGYIQLEQVQRTNLLTHFIRNHSIILSMKDQQRYTNITYPFGKKKTTF